MSDSEQTERIAQYDPNQDTLLDSEDLPLQSKKFRSANRVYKFIESFTSSESAKEALNNPHRYLASYKRMTESANRLILFE